eukprot:scaffold8714_cov52-Phaeocystis_antarctica.AAC.3
MISSFLPFDAPARSNLCYAPCRRRRRRAPPRCRHAPGGPCPRRPRGRCGSSTPGPEEEAAAAGGCSHRRHIHGNRCRRDVCVL